MSGISFAQDPGLHILSDEMRKKKSLPQRVYKQKGVNTQKTTEEKSLNRIAEHPC